MGEAEVVGNAKNCAVPVKTKTGWGSRARETAADTGRPARGQFGVMCAANCGKPVSTRTNWANKVKAIVAGTGKRVEAASS
jgi:hypothetical protein